MIIKDAKGITAEVHLYDDITGLDFVEACNGSNPDFEEPLNAQWEYQEQQP